MIWHSFVALVKYSVPSNIGDNCFSFGFNSSTLPAFDEMLVDPEEQNCSEEFTPG